MRHLTEVDFGFSCEREIQILRNQCRLKTLISRLGVVFLNFHCVHRFIRRILMRKHVTQCIDSDPVYSGPFTYGPSKMHI